MTFDPVVLATELATDPTGLGYGSDPVVNHALINEKKASIQIDRGNVDVEEIIEATVFGELASSGAGIQRLYLALTQGTTVNVNSPNIVAAFMEIFGAGTASRTNLAALQTQDGSRGEKLFGIGFIVQLARVREAMP